MSAPRERKDKQRDRRKKPPPPVGNQIDLRKGVASTDKLSTNLDHYDDLESFIAITWGKVKL
jgi:hypothetical protein